MSRLVDALTSAPGAQASRLHSSSRRDGRYSESGRQSGTIRYVLVKHVRPAIEYLAEVSRLTDEDLRRRFRRQQAKYEEWAKASPRRAEETGRAEEAEPEPPTGTSSGA